jgi:hypothetical protein
VLGYGFRTEPDSYYCEIGEPQAASTVTSTNGGTTVTSTVYAPPVYAAPSAAAHTIKARLITCLTQPYLYSAVGGKVLRVIRRVTPAQTEPVTMYNSALKGAAGATGLAFAVTGSLLEAVPST